MQFVRPLVALGCLALGVLLGVLNPGLVRIDFGPFELSTSLGVALIVALLAGVFLGGIALTASVVLPLRRRLAREGDGADTHGPEV